MRPSASAGKDGLGRMYGNFRGIIVEIKKDGATQDIHRQTNEV